MPKNPKNKKQLSCVTAVSRKHTNQLQALPESAQAHKTFMPFLWLDEQRFDTNKRTKYEHIISIPPGSGKTKRSRNSTVYMYVCFTFFEEVFLRFLQSSVSGLLFGAPACAHSMRTAAQRLGTLLSCSSLALNSWQAWSSPDVANSSKRGKGKEQGH